MKSKKMLCLTLVLSIVGLFVSASVAGTKSGAVQGNRAGLHENLSFFGSTPLRVTKSATAQQLHIGEGFLDAICVIGGVAGNYSLALDSAEGASGLAVGWAVAMDKLTLGRPAFVRLDSAADTGAGGGCWVPAFGPVRFVRGLVGVQTAATHSTLYYVHTSSGNNPGFTENNLP